LEAARRISLALSQHSQVGDLVEKVLQISLEVLDAATGSVLLADSTSKQLVFQYSAGEKPVPIGTAIPWDQGIAGAVFHSGDPVVVRDVALDARHYSGIDKQTGYKTRDMITFPLKRWEGEPIGVIELLNKHDGRLNEDDISILTIISAMTAMAIEQARLFEEAKLAAVAHRLGDISHDIKNLLTPVVMGSQLMQSEVNALVHALPDGGGTEAQASQGLCNEVIGMVQDAAQLIEDRMREIADCVKGLSTPPRFEPCLVGAVVDGVVKTLGLVAKERHLLLCTEGIDALPPIMADERRLFNALYNLVNNAIPEVPAGGSITIQGRAAPEAGGVVVSVADTGRGMRPEVLARLFTGQATSRKPGSIGLGTKIVKDVVDAHGGRVTVDSQEGKGTTFHVFLPFHPPVCSAA
jgi:signal transduction histidine kinase